MSTPKVPPTDLFTIVAEVSRVSNIYITSQTFIDFRMYSRWSQLSLSIDYHLHRILEPASGYKARQDDLGGADVVGDAEFGDGWREVELVKRSKRGILGITESDVNEECLAFCLGIQNR